MEGVNKGGKIAMGLIFVVIGTTLVASGSANDFFLYQRERFVQNIDRCNIANDSDSTIMQED